MNRRAYNGIKPHHTLDKRPYEPLNVPLANSSSLHSKKPIAHFQPYDLARHTNHLTFPAPHTVPMSYGNMKNDTFFQNRDVFP